MTATLAIQTAETTVALFPLTPDQVADWTWVGNKLRGEEPVNGFEVYSLAGDLLGVILPLGPMASRLHVEYFDPHFGDFFPAGEAPAAALTRGVSLILGALCVAV